MCSTTESCDQEFTWSGNWHGKVGKGAMRVIRAEKRKEAEVRNALTPDDRRRQTRLKFYHTGGVAPHPESRDARTLRKR